MIVSKKLMQEVINLSAKTGCDYVELFVEDTEENWLSVMGGEVDRASSSRIRGASLRLALGDFYVFGSTDKIDRASLLKLAFDLSQSFHDSPKPVTPLGALKKGKHHHIDIYPEDVTYEMRKDVCLRSYNASKSYSSEIVQAFSRYNDSHQSVVIGKMDGRFVSDERIYTRLFCGAIASDGKSQETGFTGPGRMMGYELFKLISPEKEGEEAAHMASVNLHAAPCPSGVMPVIINNGFGGVIFHESCGHALEATSVGRGVSIFTNKLGKQIANSCLSAVDDGTIENAWGSENFDDEGYPQIKRELIKNGILTSYMIDEIGGRKMKINSTHSSRTESYKICPTSRMSNTYIVPGKATLDEMLKGIKYGLYAKSLGGGSVVPATGDFNFAVTEGYMIRNGKIAEAVKGASLVGNGAEILMNIDMIGKELDLGQGMCGSVSGSIPVNVGQPPIRIQKITVGGKGA